MRTSPSATLPTAVVRRAFLVLEALREFPGCHAAEIAASTGEDLKLIRKTLQILCAEGYVVAVDGEGYVLAYRMSRFADDARRRSSYLRALARPHLEAVTKEIGETANLLVLEGRVAVYVDQVPGARGVQVHREVGRVLPLHATASGKVLLAHRPDWRDLVGTALERFTDTTITDLSRLESELRRVRRRGYAVEAEENESGVRCVAGPVMSDPHHVAATVSVSAPTQRLEGREHEFGQTLLHHTVRISRALGYSADGRQSGAPIKGAI
ncbi:MAG: IclR family transcriptional regulator, acetate operon repressor [Gaiellales bacterium]|nr:IclR family transcriptional regulator, acetate operon repressor [Gaiellales bacterium]